MWNRNYASWRHCPRVKTAMCGNLLGGSGFTTPGWGYLLLQHRIRVTSGPRHRARWTQGTVLTQPRRSVSGVDCDSPWTDYQPLCVCMRKYVTIVGRLLPANIKNAFDNTSMKRGHCWIEHEFGFKMRSRCAQEEINSLRYSTAKINNKLRKRDVLAQI